MRELEEYRGAIGGGCPDEPQFRQLFEVLGDGQAQEDIRLAHPKVQHCEKLQINPKACNGCSKNPMKPEKLAKKERIEAAGEWFETAEKLEQQARFGLLSMKEISSTDLLLLTMQWQRSEYERDQRLALMFRNHMADLLSQLFPK